MKRILVAVNIFLWVSFVACAQTCTQTLRLANETYNAGRLHEVPKICEKCLDGQNTDQFTKEEKVVAYKLLTQSYIYLEEPAAADKAMLNLLKTDGFFEVNDKVDPAEFVAHYGKFRTLPVISITFKFGATGTFVNPIAIYNTGNSAQPDGIFKSNLGIYYGLGVEKIITKNRWTVSAEVFLMAKSFNHTKKRIFDYDNTTSAEINTAASVTNDYIQTRIDFYPTIQYKLFRKSSLKPFIAIGPGFSYLAASESELKTPRLEADGKSGNTISGSVINTTASFNKMVYSALLVVGGKLRIGTVFLTGDIRFQYGFGNVTNDNRTNREALFDYGYQIPDFKTHNVMATIGAVVPIFVPKKRVK